MSPRIRSHRAWLPRSVELLVRAWAAFTHREWIARRWAGSTEAALTLPVGPTPTGKLTQAPFRMA